MFYISKQNEFTASEYGLALLKFFFSRIAKTRVIIWLYLATNL